MSFCKEMNFIVRKQILCFIKGYMLDGMDSTVFKIQIYLYVTSACKTLGNALSYLCTLYFIKRDIISFKCEFLKTAYNEMF